MSKQIETFNKNDTVYIKYESEFNPSNGQWFPGFKIKINDPMILSVNEKKDEVVLYNYYLKPIQGAMLAIYDGKDYMPIYYFDELKPLVYFKFHIPIDKFASISKTLTKDKIQFKMINLGDEYKKLNEINVCWETQIPLKYHNCNQKHSRADVISILSQMTNFAYILTSKEFETICVNFEKITGTKLNKLPDQIDNGKGTGAKINTDDAVRCWNLNDPNQKEFFYKVMGIGSKFYSGKQNRTDFECGMLNPSFKGVGVTYGNHDVYSLESSYGYKFYDKPSEMAVSSSRVVSHVLIHEMAHMFGYHHYTCMCVGPLGETDVHAVQTLGYLLRNKLPYYSILSKESKVRCGFNKLEKWIYDNIDLFDNDMKESIESELDARNKSYDTCVAGINKLKQYDGLPPQIRALFISGYNLNSFFTEMDKELYNNYGNMSFFMKLNKKN